MSYISLHTGSVHQKKAIWEQEILQDSKTNVILYYCTPTSATSKRSLHQLAITLPLWMPTHSSLIRCHLFSFLSVHYLQYFSLLRFNKASSKNSISKRDTNRYLSKYNATNSIWQSSTRAALPFFTCSVLTLLAFFS